MGQISKTPESRASGRDAWLALFAGLTGAVYFSGLRIPLLGPDEPRYSQVAREMFERGDWVTTTLGGFNWFEKPALLYWLQISAYNVFGVNEFAARIGPAIFGFATVLFIVVLGARIGGGRNTEGGRMPIAFWFLATTASALGLLVFSRAASFDITVTFPLTASLVFFYLWFDSAEQGHSVRKRTFLLIGFYFFAGVATLAKGLIGIVFPAAIITFFYVLRRRFFQKELLISLIWGPVVTLLVAATWYLPMYLRHGWEFIDEFFVQHHFQRYTSNKYKHPQPFWFFWAIFPLMTIPWVPFFAAAVWKKGKAVAADAIARYMGKAEGAEDRSNDLAAFAFAWMLVPLVFFSFSGSKLPGYILPSLPPAMILTALSVDAFARRSEGRDRLAKGLAVTMVVVVLGLVHFVLPSYADADSAKGLIESAEGTAGENSKVAGYRGINHSLEFYASGRLFRDPDGKQKVFRSPEEVKDELSRRPGQPLLVVTHEWDSDDILESPALKSRSLAVRGEWEILIVENGQEEGQEKRK